ncbi:MAG: PAS domain S-box protein [Rhodospirillales bacterium]|nr:PAS domain S-box protein [Rhodospirillales bacterium]
MADRRALYLLVVITTLSAIVVGAAAIGALYRVEMDRYRRDLVEAARERAAALAEAPPSAPHGDDLDAGELQKLQSYRRLHETGRLIVARSEGGDVVLSEAASGRAGAAPAPPSGRSQLADLARRAVAGESGIATIADGRGSLLAAFEPVAGRDAAVITSLDLAEIRAPFVNAAIVAGAVAAATIALSAALIFFIGSPILARGRQGNAAFRELFENMRMGAAIFDAVGRGEDFVFRDFNRGAERMDNLERGNVIGRRLTEIFPAVGSVGLLDAMRRVARTGAPEHFPVVYYRDSQREGWREGHIYRLPSGEIVGLYEDVGDRQRAEKALRDSETRWRSIIEMQSVAMVIVDGGHKIRFLNKAAEALFAKNARDLYGEAFAFPVVPHEAVDLEISRPNGTVAYVEMRATPMRWGGEEQFLLLLQDVSAHKRAEGDLRKLFQAIEQSPVSVVITDVNGIIEYVNPKFSEVTGYTYPEVVGKNPRVLKSGDMPAQDYTALWKAIAGGNVWRGEFHNKRKNGELFWELASIAPVRDVRGKITHFVAVKEDVTERKATEEWLRRSQRLELIGQLTGGIAHDFNNVLAIILGNLQLLQEKGGGDEEDRELIADALWSAERGAELIHRLLAFARRQRLNPRIADLNHIVREMTDLLRRTLGEKIAVSEQLAAGLWPALIDRGQLENALLNLVVNARDAMPDGGKLTITTSNEVVGSELVRSNQEAAPGDYVCLSVSDTGTGMPADVLERIFEPFFTTKKFGRGNGLGLSMVYGFVHQSGGHVSVTSEVDRGTVVRLFLPRARESETPPPASAAQAETAGPTAVE